MLNICTSEIEENSPAHTIVKLKSNHSVQRDTLFQDPNNPAKFNFKKGMPLFSNSQNWDFVLNYFKN